MNNIDRKEKKSWRSVPQFGDWDHQQDLPNYSMDFSKIRELKKQKKRNISRASLDTEELVTTTGTEQHQPLQHHHHTQPHSLTTRKKILSYFNCCINA